MPEIEPGYYWARSEADPAWTVVEVKKPFAGTQYVNVCGDDHGADAVGDWELGPRLEPPEERIRIEYRDESGKHISAFYENEALNPYEIGEQFFFEGKIVEVLSVNRAGRDTVVKLVPRQKKKPVSGRRLELPEERVDKPRTGG